jgi:hypothetical protein
MESGLEPGVEVHQPTSVDEAIKRWCIINHSSSIDQVEAAVQRLLVTSGGTRPVVTVSLNLACLVYV